MILRFFLGTAFVVGFAWLITRFVTRWAAHEAQQEARRDRLRQLSPDVVPMGDAYTGRPVRAAGLRSDARRVG